MTDKRTPRGYVIAGVSLAAVFVVVIGIGLWMIGQRSEQTDQTAEPAYSLNEVATHDTPEDCWTVIDGVVYDLSAYITRHPGGAEIEHACGIDATSLFRERTTTDGQAVGSGTPHSAMAMQQLERLRIGTLEQ